MYYPTLQEDIDRAKEILAKGKRHREDFENFDALPKTLQEHALSGGTIYGADLYAAYKLLESFVEVIEAVDVKVCELAVRAEKVINPGTIDVFPRPPGMVVRPATNAEQLQAIIAAARQSVAAGAGHDCEEWRDEAGRCQLCDQMAVAECTCRTFGCGHKASSHIGGTCRECGREGCWR